MSVTIYAEKPVSNRKSMYIDTKIIKIFFCEKRCIILIKSFRCQMDLKLKKHPSITYDNEHGASSNQTWNELAHYAPISNK